MYKAAALEHISAGMEKVRELILSSLSSEIDLLNKTNEYLLGNPGKMLRSSISLLVAGLCSGGHLTKDSYRFAAASELLHNATLLHDDVADGSPLRRGKPSVMSLLGGRASVLLGDYWLVKAMDRILDADCDSNRVIRIFAHTLSDLAEGEMLQLQKADEADTIEVDYYRIIHDKTASLFCAAAESAAISVGATAEQVRAVKDYADHVGLAFQIRDDILDYVGDGSMGKPAGQDLIEQKITLPLLGALSVVSPDEAAEVRRKVAGISRNPAWRDEIVGFVKEHNGIEYAEKALTSHADMAGFALRMFPDSIDKEALLQIARYNAERKV